MKIKIFVSFNLVSNKKNVSGYDNVTVLHLIELLTEFKSIDFIPE